jgi:hypothetical protein
MASVTYTLQHGPDTFEVSAAVTGGQLVEVDGTTGKVKPATAGSLKVLGVAATDANPVGTDTDTNYANARPHVAVYYAPVDVKVTYGGAAAFGDRLIAGAAGTVVPYVATDVTASPTETLIEGGISKVVQIVGICTEPGGVANGAKGRVRLTV